MKKEQRSEEAKEWRKLYKTSRWLKGRVWHLSHNPLCVFCLEIGRAEPATVVDHIKEHKGDKEQFYDTKNWQSLCKPCHDSLKQKLEKAADLPEIGFDGWPVS